MSTNLLQRRLRKGCTVLLIAMLIFQPLELLYAEDIVGVLPEGEVVTQEAPQEEVASSELSAEEETLPQEEVASTEEPAPLVDETNTVSSLTPEQPQETILDTASSTESSDETTTEIPEATSTPSVLSAEEICTAPVPFFQGVAEETIDAEENIFSDTTTEMTSDFSDCIPIQNNESIDWVFAADSDALATSTDATSTPQALAFIVTDLATSSVATSTDNVSATTTIITGDAIATANMLNIVNTNLVNSDGAIIFSNLIGGSAGTVDFRPITTIGTEATGSCSITLCDGNQGISVNINNDAHIENLIDINATSGDNTIENADHAVIESGDAFAALNLVNIANMNFIDSQYLLVALNSFHNIDGDIVFPNLDAFFATKTSSPSVVELNNIAIITNDLNINGLTGGNETGDIEESTIHAGDAYALANTFNQINTTLGANDTVSILLNVHGTWNGRLVNAPPQLWMTQSEDGMYHIVTDHAMNEASAQTEVAGDGTSAGAIIAGTSSALIHNQINVNAASGMNAIWNADSALITTGNAYAGANIINVANANVIGRNWLLGIINIFGDFNGNIAFGRPDLWIGARIETPPPFHNSGELNYKFTIMNKGDAPANEVVLFEIFDTVHLEILESSLPYSIANNGQLLFHIGSITAGATTELTMKARIVNATPGTTITSELIVRGKETDNNPADNKERISITTHMAPFGGGSSSGGTQNMAPNNYRFTPNATSTQSGPTQQLLPIGITRTTATTTIREAGGKSTQSITITNPNTVSLSAVLLRDTLRDPSGQVINNEEFNLGTILPHEEVLIGYDITFSPNATSGAYILSSTISGKNVTDTIYLANGTIILSYETSVQPVMEYAQPSIDQHAEILGAETVTPPQTETISGGGAIGVAYAQGEEVATTQGRVYRDASQYIFAIALMLLLLMFTYETISARNKK